MLSRNLLAVTAVVVLASCSDSRTAEVSLTGPSSAAPGAAFMVNLTINDKSGHLWDTYLGTVSFSSDDGAAQLPKAYKFKKDDKGKHGFVVTLQALGKHVITAHSESSSADLAVTVEVPTQPKAVSLQLTGLADPSVAGAAQDLDLTVVDAMGSPVAGYTGTVSFASTDAAAGLPSSYTFTAADVGHHLFTQAVTLKTAGAQTVTAADDADPSIAGAQTVTVNPGDAASFELSGFPNPATAGVAGSATLTVRDAFGNLATQYAGAVHLSSSDAAATLPADYTFTPADAAVHAFDATLTTAGVQSLTAADQADPALTSTQAGILVNPGPASRFEVKDYPSPQPAGMPGSFDVTAFDAFGNLATGYVGTVHFDSSDPGATLPADYTFAAADQGTHAFSAVFTQIGVQSLSATDLADLTLAGSQLNISITPAGVSAMALSGFPSPSVAGVPGSFTVAVTDAFGNPALNYSGTVHFSSTDPQAVLPADYTFSSADLGVHVFSGTLGTAGSQSITATDTLTPALTATQAAILVTPGAAASLVVAGFPSPQTAGVAGNFTVTAYDAFGNVANGYLGTVHLSSTDPLGTVPADTPFTAGDMGAHVFSATFKRAGVQALTATDMAGGFTASQTNITVVPAAASLLALTGFPSPSVAGTPGGFTLTAYDAFGNVATGYAGQVHFTSSDAQAALPADFTFGASDAGAHAFQATLKTVGTQSLTATDATASLAGTQSNILVNPASGVSFALTGFPSPSTAGVAGNLTLTVRDPFGNLATSYVGTVHFTSSDAPATLPADYTFTAGDAGVHVFSVTLRTAGTQSISVADSGGASASQSPITVTPAAASSMTLQGFPSPTTAGGSGSFTVTLFDAFGNTASGYRGTLHFASTDTAAALPADYTFTAGDAGAHTFSAALKTTGVQTLTGTDGAAGLGASQSGITVNPAGAASLTVAGYPSPTTAGAAGTLTVTAKDAYGNLASGYRGTVHFGSSDAAAVLPADYAFTAGDSGSHAFSLTLKTTGTQGVTAADTVTASISGGQSGIVVNPAAAASFTVSGFPSPTTAGTAGNFTVTAHDAFGNLATGYRGTVHLTSSDAAATLAADYAFTAGDAGAHVFSATLRTAGTHSLTATDTVQASISGAQSGITVNPAAASSLVVSGFPSPTTAGAAGSFTVTAKDGFGNVATGYRGTVHFTSTDGAAALPADYAFTAGDSGAHGFSGTLKTAGTQSLTGSDTVTALITGTQSGIVVNPAAGATLALAGFPSPTTAGSAGAFTVTVRDAFGNQATGYRGTVHFTSSDASATLPGDYAFTAGDAGTHAFAATLRTAGTRTLTGTDTVNGAIAGTQSGIVVNPAAASSFTVAGFPSPQTAGVAGNVTVTAYDAFGNVATGYRGTAHFSSTDGAAILPANYAFTAGDSGSHVFSATLRTAGARSLTATDTVTASITGTQSPITVTPAAAASLTASGFPSPTTAGAPGNLTVTLFDAFGNVASGYLGTLHLTSTDAAAALPANYTFTAGDAGAHVFSATLKTVGTWALAATDTVTASLTGSQAGIVVSPAAAAAVTVAGFPSPTTAGSAGTFSVTVKDAFGNLATGYRGTLHFNSTDASATLPADYTFTAGDAGAHTFGATLRTAGTRSLTATDTASATLTGTQSGIVVNPAAATSLTVAGFPSPTTAGAAGSFTVTAHDSFGNVASGYLGTVHFTSSDAQAALPANYTFTAGDAGAHTFSGALKTAATQSLTATDTVSGPVNGTQSGIVVNPAAAASLTAAGFPSPTVAGAAGNLGVTLFDAYGNLATGYRGTVHFTSSDGAAALPANYTFTAGDSGAHVFSLSLKTVGTQSLTATDTVTASISGTQTGVVVTPAAASTLAVSGFPSPQTAGVAGGFSVTVRDSYGNLATGYRGTLHFNSTDGAATLPADYTFTAGDSGAHAFAATLRTAGTRAITGTDTVNGALTGTQSGIVVNPAAATSFTVAGFPSPQTAGVAGSFTVTAHDVFGNVATGYLGTAHFTSSDGAATLPANYAFTAGDAGAHTFSATLKTAGGQTLTATDTVTASITGNQAVTVNPAAGATLVVAGFPNPQNAGVAGGFTVTVKDAFGNLATGYRGTVHLTSSDGAATLPANYTFTAADAGVHSFTATFATVGTQSLTGTDTVTASITGSQTGIVVNPASGTLLVVAGYPSPTTAGSAGSFSITVKDAFGNLATGYRGTVHFTSTDAQATLPADYTFTAGDSGAHTFSATLKTVGTRVITATDTADGSISGAQGGIVVNPAAAASFTVTGFPSPTTAGVAGSFTVTAHDAYGNVATGYLGTAHFTSSDGAATLPANYAFTAGDAGAHGFSATLKTAGSRTLVATDTVTASITGTQTVTVNAAAASSLVVAGFPSPQSAGVAGGFTVTARDAFGNTATGYRGTVHLTSSDAAATLPSDYAFTAGDGGAHGFSATLKTVGTQSLTATDTVAPSLTGTQSPITVSPATAASLTVAGFPSPTTAGAAGSFTVTAKDGFGNLANGYRGTVHFTSTDGAAALPADYTFTAGDNGAHTFSATLKTAGSRALTATDTVTASITGTQSPITVNPAAAASFTVAGFPSPQTAGVAGSFTVTALDAFGNVATGYLGTAHFTSSDGAAALPANYAFTAGDAGAHTFSATLKTAGSRSLTATDTVTASITGTQTVTVNPAAASSLVVAGFPSPATAGSAGSFSVTAKDAFGNTATGYRGSVHLTSSDAAATLPSDYAFTAGDNGAHTFSATLKTVGSRSLTATDTVTASITGTQSPITVNPAGASSFTVAGFPSPQTAGVAGSFTVTAKDAFGNTASGYVGTVHFTSTDGAAALPANYNFLASDNGAHTFSATLKTAGSRALTATDTVTASITGTQSPITVNPGAAASYAVAGFPSPQTAGVAGGFTVTAHDAYGNVATGYLGTAHFTSSDGAATLPANYAFTAGDAGAHSFSATLRTAGARSLVATDTVTASITGSQTVTVSPAAAARLTVGGLASPRTAGTAGTLTVTAVDAFANTATGYLGTVHFTSSDSQAALPADYAFTAGDAGSHAFTVTLKTVGTQSVTATDTVTVSISGSQGGIVVNPAGAASFTVAGLPSPRTAGTAGTFTVTAKDAFGNTATGYLGTAHFTSTDGAAVLPANYAFTAGDAGAHSFSATLKTAGTRALTATDTVTASITGTQSGIVVTPAAIASFLMAGFPNPATAGAAGSFTLTAKDAYGNTVTAYLGSVRFSSSDVVATLPATYTFTGADAGVHTFSATLRRAGSQSISAFDTVSPGVTGSQTVTVNPANASSFTVSGFPSPQTAGVAANVAVTAYDPFSNLATGYRGTVHFTSSDTQAALPANYAFTAGDAGAHVFPVTLKTAGTHSITVTDTVTASITGSQTGIVVLPAAPSSTLSTISCSPSRLLADGASLASCTATFIDPFGNRLAGATATWSPSCYAFGSGSWVGCSGEAFSGGTTTTLDANGTGTNAMSATVAQYKYVNATVSGVTKSAVVVYLPTQVPHAAQSWYPFNTQTPLANLGYITSLPGYPYARVNQATPSFALNFDHYATTTGTGTTGLAVGYVFGGAQWVTTNYTSNNASYWPPSGSASTLTTGTAPVDVTFGDVNGDNSADMLIANRDSNTVSLFWGGTSGSFSASPNVTFGVGTHPRSLSTGRRPDGRGFVAVANEGSDTVSVVIPQVVCFSLACVWTNAGFTITLPAGSHPMGVLFHAPSSTVSRLLVSEPGLDQVQVYDITSSNTASLVQTLASGYGPVSLAQGSYYDGTNWQTLVGVANYINAQVQVYWYNGSSWSTYSTYTFTSEVGTLLFADPNFDCQDELFMTSPDGWSVNKLLNFRTGVCPPIG